MAMTYTTYEARAKFLEVLRQVREGEVVTVSYHGEPVAEIGLPARRKQTQEERDRELERMGALQGPKVKRIPYMEGENIPGALELFLAERD